MISGFEIVDSANPTDTNYLTVAEAKAWLDLHVNDTGRDDLITDLITGAREGLETDYRVTISERTRVFYIRCYSNVVHLPTSPVTSITSVEYLSDTDGTYTTLTGGGTDYYITGVNEPVINLASSGLNLRVTAVCGYKTIASGLLPRFPAKIKTAWKVKVKALFDEEWKDGSGGEIKAADSTGEVEKLMAFYDKRVI